MNMKCLKCKKETEVKVVEEKLNNDTTVINIVCSYCNNKTVAYYLNDTARKLQEAIKRSTGSKRSLLQKELKNLMLKLKKRK